MGGRPEGRRRPTRQGGQRSLGAADAVDHRRSSVGADWPCEDAASLTDDDSKPGAWGAADLGEEALVPASGPRALGEEYTAWSPAGVRPLEILDRAGTDPEAKKVLVEVATTICQVEAPIARHRLYVKISRAFGLSRTVKSREESIRTALGEAFAYSTRMASCGPAGRPRSRLRPTDATPWTMWTPSRRSTPASWWGSWPRLGLRTRSGPPGTEPVHVGAQAAECEEP